MLASLVVLVMAATPDAELKAAIALYDKLEYEQAIIRLEAVAVRHGLPPETKARALLWLGLSYAGLGDDESAQRDFRLALETDPTVALPPKTSPRTVATVETLRATVLQERAAAEAQAKAEPPASDAPVETPGAPAPSPASPGLGPAVLGGVGGAALGALTIAAGGTLAALSAGDYDKARDPDAFQVDAKSALDAGKNEALAAWVLVPVGVALLIGGGAVAALGFGP